MRYKVGDRVRIKSLDWYNKNKDLNGNIVFSTKVLHFYWRENVRTVFTKDMTKFCGKVVTIGNVWTVNYSIVEGTHKDYFTDEMIEGPVWSNSVWCDVIETLDELARVQLELKNCTKGTYTHCETDEQLVNYIQELTEKLEKQLVC